MKRSTLKKMKIFFTACFAFLAIGATALFASPTSKHAVAEETTVNTTLASNVYQTNGASVRVFNNKKQEDGTRKLVETDKKGIRFHVETGAGYQIAENTPLLDVTTLNEKNGSYKLADGYKTYTLVIPTRLLSGDLSLSTDKVMAIDTSEYWFSDANKNWESVAYIYNIPKEMYTDEFSYRGIICDENGTQITQTNVSRRTLSYVAKMAYKDTIDENSNYWGTADLDSQAAPLIKQFVPTYNVTYKVGEATTTEEVLWGDVPQQVPTENVKGAWYNETLCEEVDVSQPLTYDGSQNFTFTSSVAENFVFTGVKYTDNGFDVYATLPTEHFAHNATLNPSALDMVNGEGEKITPTAISVMVEGEEANAKSRLCISFNYPDIENGDKLTILKTSNFYYSGAMYELEQDYTFTYNNSKWELPLGYILQGDITSIVDFEENGEKNIRITFNSDFLINGDATLSGDVYVTRTADNHTNKEVIENGYYYWNQGSNKILELPFGAQIYGKEDGDILTITAGTKLIQNNGFYEFSETITATFNGNGTWVLNTMETEITASEFISAATRSEDGYHYIDVQTNTNWGVTAGLTERLINIVINDGELVYHDTDNVHQFNPTRVEYHGYPMPDGSGSYQLLRIYIDRASLAGDWVTIPEGTEFWLGSTIFKLTEEVKSYFVDDQNDEFAGSWVNNPTITDITKDNFTNIRWEFTNLRFTTDSIWSSAANNRIVIDSTFIEGNGIVCDGSIYTKFFYYGGTNQLLELQGLNFTANGGSVTLEKGMILWLFNNSGGGFMSAYRLGEEITVKVSGAAGSSLYKDVELLRVTQDKISSITNDNSHKKEIRFNLNDVFISGIYAAGNIEGSSTLNGEPTTKGFVYGGDGTSGYKGNTIVAFTGEGFNGKPFQASAIGDKLSIAAGTKIWLKNGYVLIVDELNYVWNGSTYIKEVENTVTFSMDSVEGANVLVDGVAVSSATVTTGKNVTFTVSLPNGYGIASVLNATKNDDGSYTTNTVWANVTVEIVITEPIILPSVISVAFEGTNELRIWFEKTDAISEVTGGNYNVTFNGTTELTLGGVMTQPTQYNYYGLINDVNHQILGFYFDVTQFVAGDYLSIKAGSTFSFGSWILLVGEDITVRMVSVKANFDSAVSTVSFNGTQLTNGVSTPILTVNRTSHTVVYGWVDSSNSAIYDLSVKFDGEEQGSSGTYTDVYVTDELTIDVTTKKKQFAVTWSNPTGATVSVTANGSAIDSGDTVEYGSTISVTATANSGYQVTGISVSGATDNGDGTYTVTGATKITVTAKKTYTVTATTSGAISVNPTSITVAEGESATFTLTVPTDATIKANGTKISGTSYTVSNVTADTPIAFTTWYKVKIVDNGGSATLTYSNPNDNSSGSVTSGQLYQQNTVLKFENITYTNDRSQSCKIGNTSYAVGDTYTVTGETEITVSSSGGCLVEGTMITLADGTQKAVEDLKAGDMLIVFNHETGKYDVAPLLVNTHATAAAEYYTVISLHFSNGTVLKIADEHAVFSKTANKYVYVNALNAYEFVGHEFVSSIYENGQVITKIVTLENVTIATEYTRIFTPVSAWHMNVIADNILTLSGRTVNFFEYDETMKYDEEKMQADIEKYGLYTYEDFKDYVSEEVFNAFPFKYFKVAIEKGDYTWDELMFLLSEYNESDSEK
ncbi:MAG: hypothetical protein E7364_01355 [Clostridiales bacterium]|nr:hypothetical protein [Clostridiales bacterium]